MFAYNGSSLPQLSNHASALQFFEQSKVWRGYGGDERKLDGSKKHITIRQLHDGAIACKLHHTDVITYHEDDTITVVPWGSRSTDEFFNALTRNIYGLSASFTSGVIQVGDHFYRAIDTLRIHVGPKLEMLTKTEPFRFETINRKRAAAARELYRYNDFAAFAIMSEKMGAAPVPPTERAYLGRPENIIAVLQDQTMWPHLLVPEARLAYNAVRVSAGITLADVRTAIYRVHPDVYDKSEELCLESWHDVNRWKRQ